MWVFYHNVGSAASSIELDQSLFLACLCIGAAGIFWSAFILWASNESR